MNKGFPRYTYLKDVGNYTNSKPGRALTSYLRSRAADGFWRDFACWSIEETWVLRLSAYVLSS